MILLEIIIQGQSSYSGQSNIRLSQIIQESNMQIHSCIISQNQPGQRTNYKISMNTNNTLVQLIYGALKSQNNQQRKHSEKLLLELRQTNPNEFFLECAGLLVNKNLDQFIRISSSTLLINSIRLKANNFYLWDSLQASTRQEVKKQLMNTLIDERITIMRAGANVISHIANIQVPRGQWLDLVDILATNTGNQNVAVRKASIITIGNICQQFHESGVSIETRACQQFLGGIIIGANQKHDNLIVQQSIRAFRNSLSFLKPILGQQTWRSEIFKIIYSNIMKSNDDRTAYEALFEFCKACYDYLDQYLTTILQMTITHLRERNQHTIMALQLLDTIGTQYLQQIQDAKNRTHSKQEVIQNYLLPLQAEIMPEIMRCLLIESQEDLDTPQLRISAAKTLSTFAAFGNKQTVDIIVNGTATCLKSQTPMNQQASAILLSTLCENSDKEYVTSLINQAFEPLFTLLNSANNIVIHNTLNGLATIAEFYPELFFNNKNIQSIITKLFELIDPSKQNITSSILVLLKNMTESLVQNCLLLSDAGILLTKIVNFFQKCIDNYEGSFKEYTEKTLIVIMNYIIKFRNREVLLFMIEFLMNKYYYFYEHTQLSDKNVRLTNISSVIHTCILALENMIPQDGLINNLCGLINKHILLFGVQEQGLNLISAMVITFNKSFQTRSEYYWQFLETGLSMVHQPRIFKAALFCVGDYSRVYAHGILAKQFQMLERLLMLVHQNFQRDIKICILSCIADLLLGLGESARPHLHKILDMINICFQAVYELSTNPAQKQYTEELKRSLIDLYACMAFAMNSSNQRSVRSEELFNHFPNLANFVVNTCHRDQNPTIEYFKACLFLLFDAFTFYQQDKDYVQKLVSILKSPPIQDLVNVLNNFKQRQDIRELQDFIRAKMPILF